MSVFIDHPDTGSASGEWARALDRGCLEGRASDYAPARIPPTPRQLDLLRFIAGYLEAHGGVAPTFVEMVAGIGASSNAGVFSLLASLEERGLLRRMPGKDRAIELLVDVPIPRAPDGAPLYFVTRPGTLPHSGRSPAAAKVCHRKEQAVAGLGNGHARPRMAGKGEPQSPSGTPPFRNRAGAPADGQPAGATSSTPFHGCPDSREGQQDHG